MAQLWARLLASGSDDEVEIIVELKQPRHAGKAAAYSAAWDTEQADLSAAVEHRFVAKASHLITSLRGLSHFPIVFGTARRQYIESIAALPEVFRVYEDEVVHSTRVQGAALIRADVLRTSFGGTGNGVGVAVLDTGIDFTHPELGSRVVAGGDYTGTTGNGLDDNGHGTAVAGIIAGSGGGMAPQARLWAIKVLKADGTGTDSSILDGLNAVYASRTRFGGLNLVNMSLGRGGPFNSDCDAISPYNSVFKNLYNAGIAIFVASGNDGFQTS